MTIRPTELSVGVKNVAYKIKSFKPLENPSSGEAYVAGHKKVLVDFGVKSDISSSDREWLNSDKVIAIGLFSGVEMVGGVKLHFGGVDVLPFASNVEVPFLSDVLLPNFPGTNTCEVCGLWLDKNHLKRGLSEVLVRAAVAMWQSSGSNVIFTFASQYTLSMTIDLGFEVMPISPLRAWLPYPTDDFKSYVLFQNLSSDNYIKSAHRKVLSEIKMQNGALLYPENGLVFKYEI